MKKKEYFSQLTFGHAFTVFYFYFFDEIDFSVIGQFFDAIHFYMIRLPTMYRSSIGPEELENSTPIFFIQTIQGSYNCMCIAFPSDLVYTLGILLL